MANTTVTGTVQPLFTDPTATVPDFYLGHDGAAGAYFDGALDDIQIYDVALGPSEVASLYNNPGRIIAFGQPKITSFTSAGGGVWEVFLEDGGASTDYEFRSSTTLDFSPGNLDGLSQANPGSTPERSMAAATSSPRTATAMRRCG